MNAVNVIGMDVQINYVIYNLWLHDALNLLLSLYSGT